MNTLKRKLSLLLAAAMLAVSVTACGDKEENSSVSESGSSSVSDSESSGSETELSSEEDETGFIKTLYDPNFSIELLGNGIKKVTDGDGRELILVPKTLDEVPSEYSDSIVVRTPVENAVFLSSTQVCTFRTVDDEDVISGIGGVEGDADSWSEVPAVASGLESGDIINIGGDGMGEPDYEQIQALNPDVVFVYSGEYGQVNEMAKFDELGINYAVDNEYLESTYLARMEWMRFLLTFFDADSSADAIMSNVQANIDDAKSKIEGLEKPVIAIFSISSGTVYTTSDTGWLGSMIADMGGVNAFSDLPDGSITYETAYDCIVDADVIIYSSTPLYTDGMEGVIENFPQLTECKAYENDNVYQYSYLFWKGIDQSDIMACDLAAILYPEVFADRELDYFVNLEK